MGESNEWDTENPYEVCLSKDNKLPLITTGPLHNNSVTKQMLKDIKKEMSNDLSGVILIIIGIGLFIYGFKG